MQRYFIDSDSFNNLVIQDKDIIFHITKVMRTKLEDEIIVCNIEQNYDNCYIVKIDEINKDNIFFSKIELLKNKEKYNIDLVQGLPKGNKIDDIIKNLTHLGVNKLIISPMDRSNATIKNTDNKIDRYLKIINQSAMLSHRHDLMEIEFIKTIFKIDYSRYDYIILADEDEANKIKNLDLSFKREDKIIIIIGPEGGISKNERKFFLDKKAILIDLGPYILPTELSGIAATVKILNKIDNN